MKILKIRRKHTRGLLKLVFQLPEPGWKLCGMYYTQNSERVNVSGLYNGRYNYVVTLWDIWKKPLFFPPRHRKKGGAAGEKRRASTCQHTYHTHIFPGR